ncbi:DCX-like protein [Mya arenaria]|uniref:DCX-like protein n=1 Tax=Mya arenaria TaxID=6604 RepID=A0ABY7E9H2_MYAAR|nr:DCX-like protein [Mya arenaria]
MHRRAFNFNTVSQAHRDVVDDRYRDLRRPRKVRFFVNGDRYFKGKKLYITPHRYFNFNDLLNDLTGKLPSNLSLPYGVRQIFTPSSGHRVVDIEDLQDGRSYVCAGFEGYKPIKYGKAELEPWSLDLASEPKKQAPPPSSTDQL